MSVVNSPLTGRVIALSVNVGDAVDAGTTLLVIESMKMEIPVEAETGGTVAEILVAEGDEIEEGQLAIRLG